MTSPSCRYLHLEVPRLAIDQGLEQQHQDQHRFDGAEAACRRLALGKRCKHRRDAGQRVEDQSRDPPIARGADLQRVQRIFLVHHAAQPCRHVVAPAPDDVEQPGGDERHEEDDRRRDHGRRRAGADHEHHQVTADHRQHDHDIQSDQQALRGVVVDRREAAFRRVGPQPRPEDKVETAPVDQRHQDLVGDPGMHGGIRADLAGDQPCGEPQGEQRQGIERHGVQEGPQRRLSGMAFEHPHPGALQDQPCELFGSETGDHDADQQRRHAEIEKTRQTLEVGDDAGNIAQRRVEPAERRIERHAQGTVAAIARLRPGAAAARHDHYGRRK